MRCRFAFIMAAVLAAGVASIAPTAAQDRLTGVGSGNEIAGGVPVARALTPFEEFAGKLKLDEKTQMPAAAEILNAAAAEAAPVGVQLLQIRQKLLNAELNGAPEAVKAATEEYVAAEAKMAAIEGSAFSKVLALLKPNQRSNSKNIAEAFALMAGFFQSQGAARGRGGRS